MGLTGVIMCARGLTGSADYRARVNRPNEIERDWRASRRGCATDFAKPIARYGSELPAAGTVPNRMASPAEPVFFAFRLKAARCFF
jgi:hypothetical protein